MQDPVTFSFDCSGEPGTAEVSIGCYAYNGVTYILSTFMMTEQQFNSFVKDGRAWFHTADSKQTKLNDLREAFEQFADGLLSFSEFVSRLAEFQMAHEAKRLNEAIG